MKKVRLLALLCSVAIATVAQTALAAFSNESLKYVITYKWGVVHKDAGNATLTLRNNGSNYNITLTAKTLPWADKVFEVRDTLTATATVNGLKPSRYTKTTHEGGKYARDVITYSYAGNKVTGAVTRHKEKKGKVSKSNKTLAATGSTYDMLTIFYYLRSIDFDKMQKGHIYKVNVFSGSQVETVTVKNMGLEKVKLRNGTTREAWHLRFNFTSDGKKKSSADMDTWISTDSRRIPLLLEGSLPVGKVKCYYTGG